MIDFRGADLNQVLDIYSMLVNRTLLRPATLPAPTITLTTQGQLTMREGIQALEAVLALNGITMVNVGDKFVKVVPEAQSGSAAAPFDTNSAAQLPDLGQYVTHVVQLKYAKPSELVPVLTPFVKIPNAILPLDANQILVLRDYAENVKRMLELVNKIDVAVPSEFDAGGHSDQVCAGLGHRQRLEQFERRRRGRDVGGGTTSGARSSRTRGTDGPDRHRWVSGSTTPGNGHPARRPGHTRRRTGQRAAHSRSACRTSSTAPPTPPARSRSSARPRSSRTSAPIRCSSSPRRRT